MICAAILQVAFWDSRKYSRKRYLGVQQLSIALQQNIMQINLPLNGRQALKTELDIVFRSSSFTFHSENV